MHIQNTKTSTTQHQKSSSTLTQTSKTPLKTTPHALIPQPRIFTLRREQSKPTPVEGPRPNKAAYLRPISSTLTHSVLSFIRLSKLCAILALAGCVFAEIYGRVLCVGNSRRVSRFVCGGAIESLKSYYFDYVTGILDRFGSANLFSCVLL